MKQKNFVAAQEAAHNDATAKEQEDKALAMENAASALANADASIAAAPQALPKKGNCPTCNKFFKNLEKHIIIHSGEQPFACPHCDHRCNRASNMTLHVKNMHKAKYSPQKIDLKDSASVAAPAAQKDSASMIDDGDSSSAAATAKQPADDLSCCGTKFKNAHALNIHIGKSKAHASQAKSDAEELEAEDVSLSDQPKRKKSKPNVTALAEANPDAIMCTQCSQEFETRQGLGSHMKYKHPAAAEDNSASAQDDQAETEATEFPCTHDGCERVLPTLRGYNNHMRTHKDAPAALEESAAPKFKCTHDDCERGFNRQQDLTKHMNSHLKNKRWFYVSEEEQDGDDAPQAEQPSKPRVAATAAAAALKVKTEFPCTHDGCTRSFKNAAGLKDHVWKRHDWNAAAAAAASKVKTKEFSCPHPGCTRAFGKVGGLKTHLWQAHPAAIEDDSASAASAEQTAATAGVPCTFKDCKKICKGESGLKRHIGKLHKKSASAKADSDSDDATPLAQQLKSKEAAEVTPSKVNSEINALEQRLAENKKIEERLAKLKQFKALQEILYPTGK